MSNQVPYTHRILSRCCGGKPVSKGEAILCNVDCRIIYNWFGFPDYFSNIIDKDLNGDIPEKEKIHVVIDHLYPPRDQKQADYNKLTTDWCERAGLSCSDGEGIGHTLAIEQGWVKPGDFVTHFDPHVNSVGAIGALGIGSAIEMLISFTTGKAWINVPPVYRIDLTGTLKPGVMGRDLINYMIAKLGTTDYCGASIEFYWSEDSGLTLDDRVTICNLAYHLSAQHGIFVPVGEKKGDDSTYEKVIPIDLSSIEPYIVAPPATTCAAPLSAYAGKKVDVGIIGTCSGGGFNDVAVAAKILKGKKVKKGVKLYVCPATNQIFSDAIAKGYIADLVEAGVFISSATCDFCYGRAVYVAKGECCITSATLNVPGRLGSMEAEIFLASPAAVAVAALTGEITDPRGIYGKGAGV